MLNEDRSHDELAFTSRAKCILAFERRWIAQTVPDGARSPHRLRIATSTKPELTLDSDLHQLSSMTAPSYALSALLAQHDALRDWMATCDRLMARLDDGQSVEAELARAVADLRAAFDAHNTYEESLLRPVLLETDSFGPVRIDRMVADHVGEHRAIHDGLTVEPSAAILRGVLATLRTHLAEEERYFLSSSVLHDDLVSVEPTG